MWNLNYSRISEIENVLKENGLGMTKKFGQNFLISAQAREKIVSLMDIKKGDVVWEIGPGIGALTHLILAKGAVLKVFEIDHGFSAVLRGSAFYDEKGFSLVEGDALKTIFNEKEIPDLIVGNLPYNVGSQIIARIIEKGILPKKMVFTLQKEVVERMLSKPGEKDYSSFSLLTQLEYNNRLSLILPPSAFYPPPSVSSAVVVMDKKNESPVENEMRGTLLSIIRTSFLKRRKTLRNNLSGYGREKLEEAFRKAHLSGSERAEELSEEDFVRLAEALN